MTATPHQLQLRYRRVHRAHDLAGQVQTVGVARTVVDPDYTATIGLDRDQARALVAAADADRVQALRTAAMIRLLLHNTLRVDEACSADVADLGTGTGHRVRIVRRALRLPATVRARSYHRQMPGSSSGFVAVHGQARLTSGGGRWPAVRE